MQGRNSIKINAVDFKTLITSQLQLRKNLTTVSLFPAINSRPKKSSKLKKKKKKGILKQHSKKIEETIPQNTFRV